MDILMLYHRLPYPPNKGEKMRAYQQVKYLSGRHRVWLACFVDDPEDYQYIKEVQQWCYRMEVAPLDKRIALSRGGFQLLRGKSLTEGYYGSPAMWRIIEGWNADHFFDVGFAFSSSMAVYIEDLPVGRRVVDMNDFDSHKWNDYANKSGWPMSHMFRLESNRLAVRELELIRKCDLTLMVNARECDRLQESDLRSKVTTFRTPIDVEHYASTWGIHTDSIVGYVGTMNYRPNVEAVLWFAEHVWPAVAERNPQAWWWIVGRDPMREVRRLERLPRVRVTGRVDEIRRYLSRMKVFVAPAQTEIGVQTKVLEAMAAGRPVVISPQGHDGIKAQSGKHYLVAANAGEFANSVCDLLSDHRRCETMADQAVGFIRNHYDVSVLMPQLESLILGDTTASPSTDSAAQRELA